MMVKYKETYFPCSTVIPSKHLNLCITTDMSTASK